MTITVTDNGTNPANLTDAETITITVDEVNVAPVLGAIGNKSVNEQATLTFTATATDQDAAGADADVQPGRGVAGGGDDDQRRDGRVQLDADAKSQGGASYTVTITVTDNGTNPANLTDAETITITVGEVNVAPVLGAIGDKSVNEQATLAFTATATDQDVPAQTLTYSLDAASLAVGMTINASTRGVQLDADARRRAARATR